MTMAQTVNTSMVRLYEQEHTLKRMSHLRVIVSTSISWHSNQDKQSINPVHKHYLNWQSMTKKIKIDPQYLYTSRISNTQCRTKATT